jgi:sugar/nucleoside kinase (ribokinase family)
VVTLGADGSYFNTGVDAEFIPGFEIETIDSTGCGDAFIAGLLTQVVSQDRSLSGIPSTQMCSALRYANAVGALTALKQGVIPALPTREQVENFLSQQPNNNRTN